MLRLQPPLIILAAASLMVNPAGLREMILLGLLHLAVFFVSAMVCHGQLAADRPAPERLTEFYLWMSLGGVLGGLFCALAAPLIFKSALEYPLMMVAACVLRPPSGGHPQRARYFSRRDVLPAATLLFCMSLTAALRFDLISPPTQLGGGLLIRLAVLGLAIAAGLLLLRRPVAFGMAVAAVAAIGLWSVQSGLEMLNAQRSFFGILSVKYDSLTNAHELFHGATSHGVQSLYTDQRRDPQRYYHRTGPLGEIFAALKSRRPFTEVGILGLGAGTIAAYAEPGERFVFYEIDPAVERIAWNPDYFTYLSDCRGTAEVVSGDARLSLENAPRWKFDLLVLDVFNSDAVPVHLITRQALELYRSTLAPHGVLAFHISSRYFDLEPVLGRLAAEAGLTARIWRDRDTLIARPIGWNASVWIAMAEQPGDLGSLMTTAHWVAPRVDPGPIWTDDYSNVVGTLVSKSTGLLLVPSQWLASGNADRAAVHGALAHHLLQDGLVDDAIDQFEKSLALEPHNALEHFGLAAALASRGRTEDAAYEYIEALKIDPNIALAHRGLGVALGKLNKLDEATLEFRRAVAIDPSDAESLLNLGNILQQRKELDEAAKCYRQGIAIKPDGAELHFGLGHVLAQLGKVRPDALDEFRAALPLAQQANNAVLVKKIEAEIRRCEGSTQGKAGNN
jgi:tetratricopeptide (TPR) repeat protein